MTNTNNQMTFTKMNGLGNDFVVLDARLNELHLTQAQVRNIADRDNPVTMGCDQIMIIRPARGNGDCFAEIRNADGGEVEACGNGTRAVAAYLNKKDGLASCRIETLAGELDCATQLDRVNVTMPAPKFSWQDIPLSEDIGKTNGVVLHPDLPPAFLVNVGNPHAVIFAAKKTKWMASKYGSELEHHELFPNRANINFVQQFRQFDRPTLGVHTWERGAGLTQACGTGACAVAIAAIELGVTRDPNGAQQTEVDVMPPFNTDRNEHDIITIRYQPGASTFVMRGPVAFEFDGQLSF
ncbi:MAG: diaminopimelate epimerase [Parvibaculales bacterium]